MGLSVFGVINPNVAELVTVLQAKYRDALQAKVEPWARLISGFTSSNSARLKFPIDLTALDGFREWVGGRDVKDGDIEAFFLDAKPYERSIGIPLDLAQQPGEAAAYVNKVPALVLAAQTHPNRLVAEVLQTGKTTTKTWDGVPLFSENHPVNKRDPKKGNYKNIYTAMPFNAENFAKAKAAFRKFKGPDGKTSLGMHLTHVLGPTDLEESFDGLFKRAFIATPMGKESGTPTNPTAAATQTNIYFGGATPIIAPELDNEDGVWYGICVAPGVNPVELQLANNGEPDIRILGDGTEHATLTNEMVFAAKLYGTAGAAIPTAIIRFEP